MSANAKHAPMCKRRDCFNAAFSDGYCGAHLKEHRTRKAGSYRAALAAERDSLRAINADLLAALKAVAELWESAHPDKRTTRLDEAHKIARAAIARAEGGKP